MFPKKHVYFFSYLYLLLPVCIFLLGWVRYSLSIPLVGLSVYCLYRCIYDIQGFLLDIFQNKKKIFVIIGVIFIWVFLSGIGAFVWQNPWDHAFRNAVFRDLVTYNWPVLGLDDGGNLISLCYYIGYWLPSAFFAKLFSSIVVGNVIQLVYAFVGVVLAFLLLSEWLGKISYVAIIILIFFSGLDILVCVLHSKSIESVYELFSCFSHIEIGLHFFNSSSNTTLLFWLYNQIIPFWIGFMLILLQKDKKYLFFTYSLFFLFSPFPAVALLPMIIYLELKDLNLKGLKSSEILKVLCKEYLTVQNLTAFYLLLIVALYFGSNIASNKLNLLPVTSNSMKNFVLFLLFEYGVYLILIYKQVRKNYLFYIVFSTMIVCSFIQMGSSFDFAWRTSIPASFFLMLLVLRYLDSNKNVLRSKLLVVVLIIGSITPIREIGRTIENTIDFSQKDKPFASSQIESVFDSDEFFNNFLNNFRGSDNSIFFKYIMKRDRYEKSLNE